jgi:hypothetical protein
LARIEIETERIDPEVQMRLTTLNVKSKRMDFPRRSLCLTKEARSESHMVTNPHIRGVNEIPRRVTKDLVLDIDNDGEKQERFYGDIASRFRSTNSADEINMFVFTYENGPRDKNDPRRRGPNRVPSDTETEYLCHLLDHDLFNDIWVPPIVRGLKGSEYLPYLKAFYELAKPKKNVLVAGLIPRFGRLDIRRLADVYLNQDINYLVMDFDDKNPLALIGNINATMAIARAIEDKSGAPCFVHGINVPFYRGLWNDEVLMARDILLFGFGFDCFGSSHVFRPWHPMDKTVLERIKNERKRYRLFSRNDYGYHRDDTIRPKDFDEEGPVSVTVSDVQNAVERRKTRTLESAFNAERHGLEIEVLRTKLRAGQRLGVHFADKDQIPPSVLERLYRSR